MTAFADDVVVVVVIQHMEAMRRIGLICMFDGGDFTAIIRLDMGRQCDGAAGVRAAHIEAVAVDLRLVLCLALDIGVLADFAIFAIAVLTRGGIVASGVIFERSEHLFDIVLIENAVRRLSIGKVTGYLEIVFARFCRSARRIVLCHGIAIAALAGDGDGQGPGIDLEGTVLHGNLVGRVRRRLQCAISINGAGCIGCGIGFVQLMGIAALFPDEVVVLGQCARRVLAGKLGAEGSERIREDLAILIDNNMGVAAVLADGL